jgi:cytoskeletal protein CcmA (bactofilin family)
MAMFEKSKTEMPKQAEGAAETIVGTSVKLKGNLKSDGDVYVDGILTGEIRTKGSVVVGPNANIIAGIKAKNVSIAGVVQGNVEAMDRLEIASSGRVLGDIAANILAIEPGAVFSGKSQMADNRGQVEVEPVAEITEELIIEEVK